MKLSLVIRKEAEADMASAFEYYQACREGLGHEFILCVEAALSLIHRQPSKYRKIYKVIMKMTVHRFPYAIYFFKHQSTIVVIAVMHIRRDPSSWQGRH
jgi:hypothetical protein